jgi:hypothetical protein
VSPRAVEAPAALVRGSLRDEHIVSPPWTLVALPVRDRHVDRKWPVWTVEGHSRPFAYLPLQNVDQKSRTHTEPGIRNGFGREIVPFSPLESEASDGELQAARSVNTSPDTSGLISIRAFVMHASNHMKLPKRPNLVIDTSKGMSDLIRY